MKDRLAFWLCTLAITGLLISGYLKTIDVSAVIATIVGLFIGGKAAQNSFIVSSAAKDPQASTLDAIDKLEK